MHWLTRAGRTKSFEPQGSKQEPFYEKPQPQQAFVPTATPAPTPAPGPGVSVETNLNPTDCYIVDFHFHRLHDHPDDGFIFGNFSRDEMILSHDGPSTLMRRVNQSQGIDAKPDLRWIHVPWNSMLDTEKLMKKVCLDLGLKEEAVSKSILSNDKWDDLLHHMESKEGVRATYMQTTCLDISLVKDQLTSEQLQAAVKDGTDKFTHRGANMVLFMPFLHWGREDVLRWRSEMMKDIKTQHDAAPNQPITPNIPPGESAENKFHAGLMAEQLFADKPLHLRRTLDQWYYSTTCDTARLRDNDQIVSKFGPEDGQDRKRPIIAVDQLWLWILGEDTVITCFDRRWPNDKNFQCNIVDKLLLWTLKQQARHIRNGYDLAHLIINETSGFFFNYSSTLKPSLRFHEIFRLAISRLNNQQTELFRNLVVLNSGGPVWYRTRNEQDKLFDLDSEFELVEQVRDLLDELGMIGRVYDDQSTIIDALADFQYYNALFRGGVTDEEGNLKQPTSWSESSSESRLPVRWDERDWFIRTKRMIYKYQDMVYGMVDEAARISESLQNTISLKQNSGSLFEAHASRKEAEAIMVFTLVSSCVLPLSFFTSIFGMNVTELGGDNTVTLSVAMAYIIPLSILLLAFFLGIAFKRDVRERVDGWINDMHGRKKVVKKKDHADGTATTNNLSLPTGERSLRHRWWHKNRGDGDVELAPVR